MKPYQSLLVLVSFLQLLDLTIFRVSAGVVFDDYVENKCIPSPEQYDLMRAKLLNATKMRSFGNDLILSELEEHANSILMSYKSKEIEEGFTDPAKFAPGFHIFKAFTQISESKVFKALKKMPKGGVLHAHDIALLSTKRLMKFTYKPNLWMLGKINESPQFLFSDRKPSNGNWKLVSEVREDNADFDEELEKLFTLVSDNPLEDYTNIDVVWEKFGNIFLVIRPIVTYEEVFKEYYFEALTEFLDDGVQYLEFRGTLPEVYTLNGTVYSPSEIVQIYCDVLDDFKKLHNNFIDSKFIYAPLRRMKEDELQKHRSILVEIFNRFPHFVVGFDLVGQEDKGLSLREFSHDLLAFPSDINFFFHAGETNWNGLETDENLIDAVLLGTKRIGHGYAIVKNPYLLEEIKRRDICIEINPVSNQVLKLVDDIRNHPAAILFADNYPLVVSSDDPSLWGTNPLSHDFYFAFMGITSAHSDLRFLKKLALNSIRYSSMTHREKIVAVNKWNKKWVKWLNWIIKENV